MKKTFSSKKSAFSLIELSIVLIIIGLLIAGVTGGASLIKSSELRAAISEARGWSTAVNGFYNQFNAYPGDYGTVIGSTTDAAGNANSQINAYTVAANTSGTSSSVAGCVTTGTPSNPCSYEDSVAWVQLKNAAVIDTTVVSAPTLSTSTTVSNVTFGTTNPSSKIKSSGWVFDYNTTSTQNVVVLTGTVASTPPTASGSSTSAASYVNASTASTLNTLSTGAITPTDALSIDTKVDDGVANTGKVRAVNPSSTTCASSATYTTATTTKTCALSFQVDINS